MIDLDWMLVELTNDFQLLISKGTFGLGSNLFLFL
jgi:hypothetical protein